MTREERERRHFRRIAMGDDIVARIARRIPDAIPRRKPGWASDDAILAAAAAEGMGEPLAQWMHPHATLEDQIRGYVGRYVQAYGAAGGLIDAGAHTDGALRVVAATERA